VLTPRRTLARKTRAPFRVAVAVGAAVTTLILAACGSASSSSGSSTGAAKGGTVVFGVIADLSGPIAAIFQPPVDGFKAYFNTVNKAGGINGQKVNVVVYNDEGDPAKTALYYEQLVQQHALGVVASTLSTNVLPLFPKAAQSQVPIFAFSLVSGGAPPTYGYGLDVNSLYGASVEVPFIKKLVPGKSPIRVAVVVAATTAGEASLNAFKQDAPQAGIDVVDTETYTTDIATFTSEGAKIAAAHPDVVASTMDSNASPIVVPALRQAGFDGPVIGYWAAGTRENFTKIADKNFYAYSDAVDPLDSSVPATSTVASAIKGAGLTLSDTPLLTSRYLLGKSFASALKACGTSCTGAKFNAMIQTSASVVGTDGLAGQVGFSTTRHTFVKAVSFYHYTSPSDPFSLVPDSTVDAGKY
jgi:branched-chain amino acid transport system substrate-binding protein